MGGKQAGGTQAGRQSGQCQAPTWLMGMKMTFTRKPIRPTATKPMPVRRDTFRNSFCSRQAGGGQAGGQAVGRQAGRGWGQGSSGDPIALQPGKTSWDWLWLPAASWLRLLAALRCRGGWQRGSRRTGKAKPLRLRLPAAAGRQLVLPHP